MEFGIHIDLSQNRTNFKIWCPFDEDFNSDLKKEIPKGERRWDAVDRCWRVALRWFAKAHDLIQHHYLGVPLTFSNRAATKINELIRDTDEHNAREAASAGADFHVEEDYEEVDAYDILGVTEDAPDEVVKAAFKAQARMYHPDRGGDPSKMQDLNAAFEIIRRIRGWNNPTSAA